MISHYVAKIPLIFLILVANPITTFLQQSYFYLLDDFTSIGQIIQSPQIYACMTFHVMTELWHSYRLAAAFQVFLETGSVVDAIHGFCEYR
jgi:hypothetical protein